MEMETDGHLTSPRMYERSNCMHSPYVFVSPLLLSLARPAPYPILQQREPPVPPSVRRQSHMEMEGQFLDC